MNNKMARRVLAAFVVLTVAALSSAAHSQSSPPSPEVYKKQLSDACTRSIDTVMKQIRPHIASRGLRESKDLVLMVPAADFSAFAQYEDQRVLIPVMFCVQTGMLLDAIMQARLRPELVEAMKRYAVYLTARQNDALRSRRAFDDIAIRSFNEFAGVSPQALTRDQQARAAYATDSMLRDSLAFVIAHEIAHLSLGHKPSRDISAAASRAQENSADQFASQLVRKAGFSLIPSGLTLIRFLQDEASLKGNPASVRTHPRAECRFERILVRSGEVDNFLSTPASRAEFRSFTGYSIVEYRSLMRELREDCERNP